MPSPKQYADMLHASSAGGYAFPAVNVTSSETLNAALRGFAEAESDGSVEVTTKRRRVRVGRRQRGGRGARACGVCP